MAPFTDLASGIRERRNQLPEPWRTVLDFDSILGALLGAGFGFWAVNSHAIESTESTDLYALAGAAVGLLAASLAVLALLTGFLSGRTAAIIRSREGGAVGFFRPFKLVARVSGLSILASVAGAVDSSAIDLSRKGTSTQGAVFFGVALWLFVWGVVGTTQLLRTVLQYGVIRANAEATVYLEDEERWKEGRAGEAQRPRGPEE